MDRNRKQIDWLRIRMMAVLNIRFAIMACIIFPAFAVYSNINYVSYQLRNVALYEEQ